MIPPNKYDLGPQNGRLVIKTYREGLAKKVGHDLVIDVTGWKATVTVDPDPAKSSIAASAQVASLQVREGNGGVMPLTDSDRTDIKETITGKVLPFGEITFRSTAVRVNGNKATVTGDLTLGGATRPVDLELTQEGNRVSGTMSVVQTSWGIKPHTAFLGALKVRDAVDVEVEATLPGA
jgi:polyisoprenoid-binding protein YceI